MRRATQLVSLLLTGCVGDGEPARQLPDPPILLHEYNTEHLRVHSDVERCEGDLVRWEGFADFAEGYLNLDAPGIIDLYVWDQNALDDVYWCGRDQLGGCFPGGGVIYSEVPSVEHELVHAITEDFANHDSYFVEGLAQAIAEVTAFGVSPPTFHVKSSSNVDYFGAGHFVRWLLESAGPDAFLEYMAFADAGREDLVSIYGEEVVLDFYAEAPDVYPRIYEHPAPALAYDGTIEWSSALSFDCKRDDVRGRADGRVVVREWVVDVAGFYAFWASTGGSGEIRQRFVASPAPTKFRRGPDGPLKFQLDGIVGYPFEPGTYEISIVAAPGIESGELHVWLDQANVPTWPTEDP